jgi:hypothetical protein
MKTLWLKIAEAVLPRLLELVIALLEKLINIDLDNDGKIGK